jgi:hypothetical protein
LRKSPSKARTVEPPSTVPSWQQTTQLIKEKRADEGHGRLTLLSSTKTL